MNRMFQARRDQMLESMLQLAHKRTMNTVQVEFTAKLKRLQRQQEALANRVSVLEQDIEQALTRIERADTEMQKLACSIREMQAIAAGKSRGEEDAANPDEFVQI
jgi:hypothetical protein